MALLDGAATATRYNMYWCGGGDSQKERLGRKVSRGVELARFGRLWTLLRPVLKHSGPTS